MTQVLLRHIEKVFHGGFQAIADLNLDIGAGEFVVLVGPSGCGKSTLLRILAGLDTPTSGSVLMGGRDVTRLGPRERDIAMVFQSYALYPHMTVQRNLEFGLRVTGVKRDERRSRVAQVANMLGIEELRTRKPAQLSGGQRQRVAMGRALVRQPSVFLLDEPLSNLDAKLRVRMRADLAALKQRLGTTTVYVTHDQIEAMTLGDRVAVMDKGVIQQCAPPRELFDNPSNLFVATFIGSPTMNLFQASRGTGDLVVSGQRIPSIEWLARRVGENDTVLGVRPNALLLNSPHVEGVSLRGTVQIVEDVGSERHVYISLENDVDSHRPAVIEADGDWTIVVLPDSLPCPNPGSAVSVTARYDDIYFFDGRTSTALPR